MFYLMLASGGLPDRVIRQMLNLARLQIGAYTKMFLILCGSAALMYLVFLGYRKVRSALGKV